MDDNRPHPKYFYFHHMSVVGVSSALLGGDLMDSYLGDWRNAFRATEFINVYGDPEAWYSKSVLRMMARVMSDDESMKNVLHAVYKGLEGPSPITTKDDEQAGAIVSVALQTKTSPKDIIARLTDQENIDPFTVPNQANEDQE